MIVIINSRITVDMNRVLDVSVNIDCNNTTITLVDIDSANILEKHLIEHKITYERFGGNVGRTIKMECKSITAIR